MSHLDDEVRKAREVLAQEQRIREAEEQARLTSATEERVARERAIALAHQHKLEEEQRQAMQWGEKLRELGVISKLEEVREHLWNGNGKISIETGIGACLERSFYTRVLVIANIKRISGGGIVHPSDGEYKIRYGTARVKNFLRLVLELRSIGTAREHVCVKYILDNDFGEEGAETPLLKGTIDADGFIFTSLPAPVFQEGLNRAIAKVHAQAETEAQWQFALKRVRRRWRLF